MPKWLEEGQDKSKGGCPNPDDRGSKAYPVKHHPSGTQNTDRNNPHAPQKAHKGKGK